MGIIYGDDRVQAQDSGSSGIPDEFPDVDRHSCQLLGPTALIVQALMGVLVILSLVYKRYREKPRRPWRIWLFDVSKQVVGQMFVHGVNVLVSLVASDYSSNACVFYFLNILLDTTLGVAIIYILLYVMTYVLSDKLHLRGFESGQYGDPPSKWFWARQATIYVCALTAMKFLVLGLLILFPGLFKIGEWLLSWTYTQEGDKLQVIFTMGVFPIVMNILQFWLIDSIVKASAAVALVADSDLFQRGEDHEPLFRGSVSDDDDDDSSLHRHDIENQSHRNTHSSSPRQIDDSNDKLSQTTLATDDHKSAPSSSGATPLGDQHSYPPSLSTSLTSTNSSPSSSFSRSGSPTSNLSRDPFKRRRGPPSALDLKVVRQPALNSPLANFSAPPIEPEASSISAADTTHLQKTELMQAPPAADEWDAGWDSDAEEEDWADNVGKEDWTGRRLEERRAVLKAGWDTPATGVTS